MDKEKPFEVGEWVWVWSERRWFRVEGYNQIRNEVRLLDAGYTHKCNVSRNPVIPPKPKEKRTVEVPCGATISVRTGFMHQVTANTVSPIPDNATNIRILYDIEE